MSVQARTVTVLAAACATTAALALTAGWLIAVTAVSFAAGTARGNFTLIQATAVTDRWGTTDYGARSSILSGAIMSASAFAPWVGALLASATGGYDSAFLVMAAGAALATTLVRPHQDRRHERHEHDEQHDHEQDEQQDLEQHVEQH